MSVHVCVESSLLCPEDAGEEACQYTLEDVLALFHASAAQTGVKQEGDLLCAQASGLFEPWLNCYLHSVQLRRPLCWCALQKCAASS